ncbi:hypothetical protein E6W17_27200 [Streptomyces sp. A1547]|nr:hypothetical protein E6W17_27200 [Streptomyces sp. A1547]
MAVLDDQAVLAALGGVAVDGDLVRRDRLLGGAGRSGCGRLRLGRSGGGRVRLLRGRRRGGRSRSARRGGGGGRCGRRTHRARTGARTGARTAGSRSRVTAVVAVAGREGQGPAQHQRGAGGVPAQPSRTLNRRTASVHCRLPLPRRHQVAAVEAWRQRSAGFRPRRRPDPVRRRAAMPLLRIPDVRDGTGAAEVSRWGP